MLYPAELRGRPKQGGRGVSAQIPTLRAKLCGEACGRSRHCVPDRNAMPTLALPRRSYRAPILLQIEYIAFVSYVDAVTASAREAESSAGPREGRLRSRFSPKRFFAVAVPRVRSVRQVCLRSRSAWREAAAVICSCDGANSGITYHRDGGLLRHRRRAFNAPCRWRRRQFAEALHARSRSRPYRDARARR